MSLRVSRKSAKLTIENRYATFKLFYTDKAPDDYEPPFFRPGDNEKDQVGPTHATSFLPSLRIIKWTFGTHDGAERPEKLAVGRLQTPWHG
jgi:meiosis-specific protein